jgi:formate C-acetyltransferase
LFGTPIFLICAFGRNGSDGEELLDAQAHPENHQNLIVRVGGFSQYFVKLPAPLQENIIARSENMM